MPEKSRCVNEETYGAKWMPITIRDTFQLMEIHMNELRCHGFHTYKKSLHGSDTAHEGGVIINAYNP
jgi:hypothetical protein